MMPRKVLTGSVVVILVLLCFGQVSARFTPGSNDDNASNSKFSETDTYLDLNTGKTFRMIYDGLNDLYNRDDLFALDLYVNTRTKDTMWLDDAIVVNNALLKDASGKYRINPMKVKRDGNSYKVVPSFRK